MDTFLVHAAVSGVTYSFAHKFTCPLQNMQNVNNFNKITGIMKIACYCLFNTVLNKLFHITDVYIGRAGHKVTLFDFLKLCKSTWGSEYKFFLIHSNFTLV